MIQTNFKIAKELIREKVISSLELFDNDNIDAIFTEVFKHEPRLMPASPPFAKNKPVAVYSVTVRKGNDLKEIEVNSYMRPSSDLVNAYCAKIKDDVFAFDVVKYALACLIEDRIELSETHAQIAADIINGEIESPRKKGRPTKPFMRDMMLLSFVRSGVEAGLSPTRNDATVAHVSSCDAVAQVLTEIGLTPNSYKGVKSIWLKWPEKR